MDKKKRQFESRTPFESGLTVYFSGYNSRLDPFDVKGTHSGKAIFLYNECIESFFLHFNFKNEKLYLNQGNSEVGIR